jgi:hypothetical protein
VDQLLDLFRRDREWNDGAAKDPAFHHLRRAETAGPDRPVRAPQTVVDDICLTPGPGYLCSHDQTR